MDHKIVELKQERANLVGELRAIHAAAEAREDKTKTAEERASFDKIEADVSALGTRISDAESLRGYGDSTVTSAEAGIEGRTLAGAPVEKVTKTEEYRAAFDKYLRFGPGEMTGEERTALRAGGVEDRADMLTTAATHGGYVVPISFADQVISAKVNKVALRRTRATIFNTTNGQALPVPVQSAYGAAAYLTEGSANTAVQDTGAKVTLNAYTIVSQRNVSYQLLQDSAFPVEAIVAANLGNAFAVKEDIEFSVGVGTTAILGIATASAVPIGKTTGTGHLPLFTYPELVAWYNSVAPQYRINGEFVMADACVSTLMGLVDTNNRPIWTASVIPGEPDQLFGKPIYTSTSFVAPAANTIVGVFGDFANGYGIREVGGLEMKRSDERLIDSLESLFIAWERLDGQVLDSTALASLKLAAT